MSNATATATPEQLRTARKVLALFSTQILSYRRGTTEERAEARRVLAEAIAANGAGEWDLGDAIHEARYYLGLTCLECGAELEEDLLRIGSCSRECYEEGGL